MFRFGFTRLSRFAVAVVLLVGGATLTHAGPVAAANVAVTFNCGNGAFEVAQVDNGETVTITVGTSCTSVAAVVAPGASIQGSLLVNGTALAAGASRSVAQGDTILFTAAASGGERFGLQFSNGSNPSGVVSVSYPEPTASVVDNGDGSMTITYTGAIFGLMLPAGSVCADPLLQPSGFDYLLRPSGRAPLAASPAVVQEGTLLLGFDAANQLGSTPVVAGDYQVCVYDQLGRPNGDPLIASAAVTMGTPTTSTTVVEEQVVPVHTG